MSEDHLFYLPDGISENYLLKKHLKYGFGN